MPIVVAVNKIDKPDANPAKVRQQLTEFGLVAEEYGGDTMFMDVSALNGTGIPDLLDAVLLTALAKNPDDRFQNARSFSDALRSAVKGLILEEDGPFDVLVAGPSLGTRSGLARLRIISEELPEMRIVLAFARRPDASLRDIVMSPPPQGPFQAVIRVLWDEGEFPRYGFVGTAFVMNAAVCEARPPPNRLPRTVTSFFCRELR